MLSVAYGLLPIRRLNQEQSPGSLVKVKQTDGLLLIRYNQDIIVVHLNYGDYSMAYQ